MTRLARRLSLAIVLASATAPASGASEIRTDLVVPAQAGSAAGVRLSVEVDRRTVGLQELRYGDRQLEDRMTIYPAHRDIIDGWNLTAPIQAEGWTQRYAAFRDTARNAAYLSLGLTSDADAVFEIAEISVEVDESRPVLKPFLEAEEMFGCIGHRPYFGLANHGWGPVADAVLRYKFVGYGKAEDPAAAPAGETAMFETAIGGLGDAVVVQVAEALAALGLDAADLTARRLSCDLTEADDPAACLPQLREQAAFGALAPLIGIEDNFVAAEIEGTLDFRWQDHDGTPKTETQPLVARVSLAWIDGIPGVALAFAYEEFGDVPRHIPVSLDLDRSGYSIPVTYRGARQVSRVAIPVKFAATAASVHDFQIAVTFADGSVRQSGPIRLIYAQPRSTVDYGPIYGTAPAECFALQ